MYTAFSLTYSTLGQRANRGPVYLIGVCEAILVEDEVKLRARSLTGEDIRIALSSYQVAEVQEALRRSHVDLDTRMNF